MSAPAEVTLAHLIRKLRRWESNLAANERRYMTETVAYGDLTLARVRAQLDIVRDALEEVGEVPTS